MTTPNTIRLDAAAVSVSVDGSLIELGIEIGHRWQTIRVPIDHTWREWINTTGLERLRTGGNRLTLEIRPVDA